MAATPELLTIGAGKRSFLNRDHVVLVTIDGNEIVVTTTAGITITIPVSAAILEKFVDDLANHVENNFVAVAAQPRVIG
jgi:hypothetical protein